MWALPGVGRAYRSEVSPGLCVLTAGAWGCGRGGSGACDGSGGMGRRRTKGCPAPQRASPPPPNHPQPLWSSPPTLDPPPAVGPSHAAADPAQAHSRDPDGLEDVPAAEPGNQRHCWTRHSSSGGDRWMHHPQPPHVGLSPPMLVPGGHPSPASPSPTLTLCGICQELSGRLHPLWVGARPVPRVTGSRFVRAAPGGAFLSLSPGTHRLPEAAGSPPRHPLPGSTTPGPGAGWLDIAGRRGSRRRLVSEPASDGAKVSPAVLRYSSRRGGRPKLPPNRTRSRRTVEPWMPLCRAI